MKRIDLPDRDVLRRNYRVFKGYNVKTKNRTEELEQHYVVPWELSHDDCKKPIR